ncbi:MAG: MoaD/ThiS family protein [Paracoccaceae bacterium]|nr:MoaD/ThiS family protein [Paracoccaceae bacterium]MDE2673883.1 MoaD/ThiS family protein [Paracoccaceae bacterium]MXZ50632.1 MoaD/ThiS family protein [Paracoccaceae bacterium]MYF45816.1 MoaD/ThiS family protein [Paracoccaceae bacterium]MYG10058.1 MoaD/ThiS family protein [Paracoccaceae bacterium]
MTVRVLYFSWLRERIGVPSESIETEAVRVNDLLDELRKKGERYKLAFTQTSSLCVAIDQELGDMDSDITGAEEIAFFPPMTGG